MFMLGRSATLALLPRTLRPCFSSFNKYPFLAELGLKEDNLGAYYDGKWQASGKDTFSSLNPADETVIARTRTASLQDY